MGGGIIHLRNDSCFSERGYLMHPQIKLKFRPFRTNPSTILQNQMYILEFPTNLHQGDQLVITYNSIVNLNIHH